MITQAEELERVDTSNPEVMNSTDCQQMEQIDQTCLNWCIQLFDHTLAEDAYESVMIGRLAVLAIQPGGGWIDVKQYTPIYSAVVKVARALVIESAYCTRRCQIARIEQAGYSKDKARERSDTHYRLVRQIVDRFGGLERGRQEPTPMDWILSKRTYGMHIRFNTPEDERIV